MLEIPDKLIHEINEISNKKSQGVFFIAIDGCGGAGKSTLAANLACKLGNSQIVHIDDFYKPKEQRVKITEETPIHGNFEFDRLKQQVLESLKHGKAVSYSTTSGKKVEIKPGGCAIVEGLGALGKELRNYFDYKIWVDSPEAVRRARGIGRDSQAWTKKWDDEYLPQDARYVREQAPQKEADWIVSNN
jgi:uridine kinase